MNFSFSFFYKKMANFVHSYIKNSFHCIIKLANLATWCRINCRHALYDDCSSVFQLLFYHGESCVSARDFFFFFLQFLCKMKEEKNWLISYCPVGVQFQGRCQVGCAHWDMFCFPLPMPLFSSKPFFTVTEFSYWRFGNVINLL